MTEVALRSALRRRGKDFARQEFIAQQFLENPINKSFDANVMDRAFNDQEDMIKYENQMDVKMLNEVARELYMREQLKKLNNYDPEMAKRLLRKDPRVLEKEADTSIDGMTTESLLAINAETGQKFSERSLEFNVARRKMFADAFGSAPMGAVEYDLNALRNFPSVLSDG